MRNQQESPLIRLPRELRDEIYRYAIGGNEITIFHPGPNVRSFIVYAGVYNDRAQTNAKWNELFGLSLTCRQLNVETKLLPYQLNVWANVLGTEFGDFLSQLKANKQQAITTISFGFSSYQSPDILDWCEPYTLPKQLKDCTGLKTIISRITLGAGQR
jgi:hypothetical protein